MLEETEKHRRVTSGKGRYKIRALFRELTSGGMEDELGRGVEGRQ